MNKTEIKGIIIVNPFGVPSGNLWQAERLKEEFFKLGVSVQIIRGGWKNSMLKDGCIKNEFEQFDFAVFLDKDKYLAASLFACGVKMFNNHTGIRLADDKGDTYFALANRGLNLPDTIFAPLCYRSGCSIDISDAEFVADKLSLPVIVKESYGSLGLGVHKADTVLQLWELMNQLKTKPHLYQRYLGAKKGTDIRIIVIGGKYFAAMKRINECDFRSNIACGGRGESFEPSSEFIAAAEKAAKILNLDYCGVDLLFGDDDSPYICEVNSNAFIKGIEDATGKNVAKAYAEYILNKIGKKS